MNRILSGAIISLLLAQAPAALAAEWTKVTENSVGDRFFVDTAMVQHKGPITTYWEYREFPQPNNALVEVPVEQPILGAVIRWSVNCQTKAQTLRRVNAYTTGRQLINRFDYGDAGLAVQSRPGSSAFTVAEFACDYQADSKPADTKPTDTKPTDTKPADTKPADAKATTPKKAQ
jgi:DNA-binding protein Fis